MAYKINGNVIINDSGEASLTNFSTIIKPTNISPPDNEANVSPVSVTLEITDYAGFYEGSIPRKFVQFQVANVNTFASGNIVYESGNIAATSSNVIPSTLPQLETFYWRARYISNADVFSEYSDATSFTTKAIPTVIGESFGGGFYTGTVDIGGGVCYYLILAPNATGCACCPWKCTQTLSPGTTSGTNGYANTYDGMLDANHRAGNWTATRTINGFSDWYLPSYNELGQMVSSKNSMPVGERYPPGGCYWSSTELNNIFARLCTFSNYESPGDFFKTATCRLRAIRRIPI